MTLMVGARLGPYEILAPLGAGGMGEVYKARDTRLGRTVAIKVLPSFAAANPDRRRRFEHEARAASALQHPNICGLHDIGCETPTYQSQPDAHAGPLHFLVMEFVDGRSLADRLRAGPLPIVQVLDIGAQIADALAAAHARGIIHRDLKPGNVMLTGSSGSPRVKLLDFGLAKLGPELTSAIAEATTTDMQDPLTSPGEFIGTLAYMAPEQLEGKEADARADVFAFGCVLYEMVTARRAFAGSSMASVISAIMAGTPTPAATLQPVTPYALDRLINSCLAKDRTERRESAHDLSEDLRSIAASDSGRPAGPVVTASTSDRRSPGKSRARIPSLAIGAAAVLLMTAVAAYLWTGPGKADDSLLHAVPTQLTSAPGLQGEPALSPDGSLVAFVSDAGGAPHIWVVDEEGAATLQLTFGAHPARDPAWLRDNSAVLFTSIRDGGPGVWKVPRLGGPETLVVANAADPAVSPDGSSLAFVRKVNPSGNSRIFVAPLADVADATLATTDAEGPWDHRQPAWSPDGRWLCYRARQSLWVVSATRPGARRLTTDDATALDPVWSADGRSIYYTSLKDGTAALWRVEVGSGAVSRITLGSGPERHPTVSSDGSTLAFSTEMADRNVILHEIGSGLERTFGTLRSEYMPTFCGDVPAVLFASDRVGGRDELWLQPLKDDQPVGDARRLTNHPGNVSHPACTRDGRWAAYYRIVEGQRTIWTVPVNGGPPTAFTSGHASDIHPAWSKDGTWLAFASERGGQTHIWAAPVADGKQAGPAVQVTRGPALEMDPEWSPDGLWIAYVAEPTASGADVWVAAADGRGAPRRLTSGAGADRIRWYQPDRMFVSGLWGGAAVSVRIVDPVSGAVTVPSPPIVFGDDEYMCDFDLSADGRVLAFSRTSRKGNIWKWVGRF